MNAINKLDLLRSSYKKQKEERNIPSYVTKEENVKLNDLVFKDEFEDMVVSPRHIIEKKEEQERVSNRILTIDEETEKDDYTDFLLSKSVITNTFNRFKNHRNIKEDMDSERIYLDFSQSIKSVKVSKDISSEESLKNIEDIFRKFIDNDSDKITNSQCVKIIALLIDRLEDLNKANYQLCSLAETEQLISKNLQIDDADQLALFLDMFLETYMEEETKYYELNKEEYYKLGKFEDFKKFQMSKIEKMNLVLEWLLCGETS